MDRVEFQYFENVEVTPDGTPVISRTFSGTPQHREYFTLDRKPSPAHEISGITAAVMAKGPADSAMWPLEEPLIRVYSDGRERLAAWYFVDFGNPAGHGYFVGYDMATRDRVGYIGREGFQAAPPSAGQLFAVNRTAPLAWTASFIAPDSNHERVEAVPWYRSQATATGNIPAWVCHLVSDGRLLRIDLRKHSVETILEAPGLFAVSIAQRPRREAAPQGDRSQETEDCLVVRSQTAVTVLNWEGRVERTYRLPQELQSAWFSFFPAANGKAVATFNDGRGSSGSQYSMNVVEFSPDGTVRRKTSHVTETPGTRDNPARTAWMSLIVPEPIVPLVLVLIVVPYVGNADNNSAGDMAALSAAFGTFWPRFLVTAILGVVSVVLYRRHAARCGNRPAISWTVFIFLCGVPGLLGYLWHRRWPVRLGCPSCRADAPRDRDNCARCGTLFPTPPPNGLEIFA